MPKEPENNNPENNEENIQNEENVQNDQADVGHNVANEQNNGPVNEQNGVQENVPENEQEAGNEEGGEALNEQIVPEVDPANDNLDGQPQEEGYVPPAPPEEEPGEELGVLNINAEIEAANVGQNQNPVQNENGQAQNRPPQQGAVHAEDDVMPPDNGPNDTYQHYFGELKRAELSEDTISHMLASAVMMQRDPQARVDRRATDDLARKFREQPAFSLLMADPKTANLKLTGNGVGLIELLAAKENERKAEMNKYVRPEEYAYEDSLFLTAVKEQLAYAEGFTAAGGKTPDGKTPGKSRKNKLFSEMMKQLDHAEELTTKGQQLSGDETRKLIEAVKKYNDGGSRTPGGTKKAPGAVEAMCILKRYMPVDEYRSYCSGINARRKRKIDPEAFTEKRLYGQALSVNEQKKQSLQDLHDDFSLENCAALVACATTAPKNGLIDADEYERQKAKLMENGSAFRKAMQSDEMKKKVVDLVRKGEKPNKIITAINNDAMERLGKTAQWHFNRSRNALLNGRVNKYFAGEHLSNILALHQFSLSAGMSDKMSGKSFAERAQIMQSDPVFKRMADRYALDPDYRRHINDKLREDGTGASISEEYGRVKRSMKRRQEEPEIQNQANNNAEPQAGAGA